jgi:biopolymer transport protein ExbB/TolQ
MAASVYMYKYIKNKKEQKINNYTNDHIFESIPSLFPTLGILLTSVGIIFGLWHFNENKIKASISELLDGIKFSFLATAIGLVLLLVFQKIVEYWKSKLEVFTTEEENLQADNPTEMIKQVYSVLENLNKDKSNTDTQFKLLQEQNKQLLLIIERLQENQQNLSEHIQTGFTDIHTKQTETNEVFNNNSQAIVKQLNEGLTSIQSVQAETNKVFTEKSEAIVVQINKGLGQLDQAQKETNTIFTESSQAIVSHINEGFSNFQTVQAETNKVFTEKSEAIVLQINQGLSDLAKSQKDTNTVFTETGNAIVTKLNNGFETIQGEVKTSNAKLIEVSENILIANNINNQLFETKFNEFIILLQENNTKGLVEMMDKATKKFNEQMSDLINKLVQENFAQLNQSVEKLNDWQKDNLENITLLTRHYKETTELFSHSSSVLKEVAQNTNQLVSDDSKLNEIVRQLSQVMINDEKFGLITNKLSNTVELVEKSTILYEETASKLNKWVVNEYEFKQGVEILITKLEEFKDFNSGVWDSYRKEMQTAVNLIKETTSAFNENVEKLDAEFYERLSNTLENLDSYIVTLIEREKDEQER